MGAAADARVAPEEHAEERAEGEPGGERRRALRRRREGRHGDSKRQKFRPCQAGSRVHGRADGFSAAPGASR